MLYKNLPILFISSLFIDMFDMSLLHDILVDFVNQSIRIFMSIMGNHLPIYQMSCFK